MGLLFAPFMKNCWFLNYFSMKMNTISRIPQSNTMDHLSSWDLQCFTRSETCAAFVQSGHCHGRRHHLVNHQRLVAPEGKPIRGHHAKQQLTSLRLKKGGGLKSLPEFPLKKKNSLGVRMFLGQFWQKMWPCCKHTWQSNKMLAHYQRSDYDHGDGSLLSRGEGDITHEDGVLVYTDAKKRQDLDVYWNLTGHWKQYWWKTISGSISLVVSGKNLETIT